jgi:hypothetical protein
MTTRGPISDVRLARPLFISPSEECPIPGSPGERAYSDLAERLRASPSRPSTELELTPSAPGQLGGPLPRLRG